MAISADDFKKALQLWASGVAVVTAQSEKQGLRGMTVTAFSSVSVDPPQILVCLNQNADTGECVDNSGYFTVNILTADQQAVSDNFSGGSSQEERFAKTSWEVGPYNSPMLTESIASLVCKVVEKVAAGSHWIVIGEIQQVTCRLGEPLLYYRGKYRQLQKS